MSERLCAEIWIGGSIPPDAVPGLCEAIASDGLSREWGEGPFRPTRPEDLQTAVRENRDGVWLLWLCDHEAHWGEFPSLETFLQQHRIPFTRLSEGGGDFDPETVEFRRGYPPTSQVINTGGKPVIEAGRLTPICEVLAAANALAQCDSDVDCWALVRAAEYLLREQLPPLLPKLPPWKIASAAEPEETADEDAPDADD
jgi:hypothetical protein